MGGGPLGAAYVDDQVACNVARGRGVRVHRTLHLVVNAYRAGVLTEPRAQGLIRNLVDADARFPQAARDDLFTWARTRNPPLL
jgi:predicted nucleic acid-binding protein